MCEIEFYESYNHLRMGRRSEGDGTELNRQVIITRGSLKPYQQ